MCTLLESTMSSSRKSLCPYVFQMAPESCFLVRGTFHARSGVLWSVVFISLFVSARVFRAGGEFLAPLMDAVK